MDKKKFYITTAIAYTSKKPHIGNTYEIVLTDAIARFRRYMGDDVFFLTGTDEDGQKIQEIAEKESEIAELKKQIEELKNTPLANPVPQRTDMSTEQPTDIPDRVKGTKYEKACRIFRS